VGERSQLIEKNEMARQKIETMINRLRNLSAEQ
jgi:cell division protein ZapB